MAVDGRTRRDTTGEALMEREGPPLMVYPTEWRRYTTLWFRPLRATAGHVKRTEVPLWVRTWQQAPIVSLISWAIGDYRCLFGRGRC